MAGDVMAAALRWISRHADAPERAARGPHRGMAAIKHVAERALAQQPQEPQQPAALSVPPRKPTEAMIEAGRRIITPERCWTEMYDAAMATQAQQPAAVVPADFTEWLAREMPAGTVIGDPHWWAKLIARRFAQFAATQTPPAAAVVPAAAAALAERNKEDG